MKKYIRPYITIVKMEAEYIMNSFSSSGTIDGPVGAKPGNGLVWNLRSHSLFDEEYEDEDETE